MEESVWGTRDMIQWGSDLKALSGAPPEGFSLRGKHREVSLRSWLRELSEHIYIGLTLILRSSENSTGKFLGWGAHLCAPCGELSQPCSRSEIPSRDTGRGEIGITQEPKFGELNLGTDFRGT